MKLFSDHMFLSPHIGSEVLTAVTMKSTNRSRQQGELCLLPASAGLLLGLLLTLKMEVMYSSKTLGFLRTVWHYDPKECAVVTHFLIHS
jgi:hypothetical protein